MPHFAFGFQRESRFIGAAGFELLEFVRVLRVHEIKIEIINAAGGQLLREKRANLLLAFEETAGQLVGEDVLIAGVTAGQTGSERGFAFALNVAMRGVKIVEAFSEKGIDHLPGLVEIDLAALHRQAHCAETEILFDSIYFSPILSFFIFR